METGIDGKDCITLQANFLKHFGSIVTLVTRYFCWNVSIVGSTDRIIVKQIDC